MSLSLITVIVVVANGLMATVAALLLMLVLWQAPHQRANRFFALTMVLFMGYGISNGFGRFVDALDMDATALTYVAINFYGLFTVSMFLFATEYAGINTPIARALRVVGIAMAVAQTFALWDGRLLTNIRPAGLGDGSYRGDWTMAGWAAAGFSLAYHMLAMIMFYRMRDPRARVFWRAPALVAAALTLGTFLWPIVPIPFNAVLLALALVALGQPVLKHELFNPLAEAHAELEKRNRELAEASVLKNRFLSNVSYELRTPLNSIIGYTELVMNGAYGSLNDTQRDRLNKIVRNGYHLLDLINDVLDLNKIETGSLVLEPQPIATPALLDSVVATVDPFAAEKGLTLTCAYADAPPLLADEMRARQIMMNLLSNAVKFTHEGSVTLRAFREVDMVRVEVADTGIGIPPDQYDRVFMEFEQVDNSSTRRYPGAGLGMAITKRLVELHGGRIWVDSTAGGGTTFYVTLPCASAQLPESARSEDERAALPVEA